MTLPPDSREIFVGNIKWRVYLFDDGSVGLNALGGRSTLSDRQQSKLNDAVSDRSDRPEVKSVIWQRVDRPSL